ncbi:MAG TPA: hypothetical protein VFQ12_03840 [Thermoleophilaceae bacterium]|nr:hypothetical protein [Thermoleophilaceae bacterium]
MIAGQLALLDGESLDVDTRRLTSAELRLRKVPAGAERLLAEMVKRGLAREHIHAASALILQLEEQARR